MSNDKSIITKTNDGYVVEIFAKTKKEIEKDINEIAEGISILDAKQNKTEEEQFLIYKEIVEKMDYNPVVMETCEKAKDENVLKTQLKAMLRASKGGDLSIAFPKISSVIELREYKEILEECKRELEKEEKPYRKNIKIGTIVEIPSAALMSYEIARECDFLFIDTNSLTKYVFGNKEKLPDLYTKFQPAVIKLVQQAIEGAHDAGIYCGICGDAIENELYMPLLIGLGLDQFSLETKNIQSARKTINELDKYDCKMLVEEISQLRTLEDIEKKLKQFKKD